MKPTDRAQIANALGISIAEAEDLETEWRHWRNLQLEKRNTLASSEPRLSPR